MSDVRIFIERPLPERQLSASANMDDLSAARKFGSPRRRAEFLMWRRIVRRELGEDVRISYSAAGAPVIENGNLYIGVSHSPDFVAVIISERRCAVDAERLSRDFGRVADRYIAPCERLLSDDERLAAALWCAKETMYKYSGRRGLNLLEDLRVESVDFDAGRIAGRICGGDLVEMRMSVCEDNLVVYIG
ncbi:MAG: 4'-phosphopantetheinyl transferase superfamily protein [Alistipes sp.]|nr:4'-phosphopantetheinyl transferase superfamily protein [Alistipes sp.]